MPARRHPRRPPTHLLSESHARLKHIIRLRFPWLVLGLLGGVVTSLFVSNFEMILSQNIRLAFFLPLIVYMSDAVGTQTETLFVREVARHKLSFWRYLLKELQVGLVLGVLLGALIALVAQVWLGSLPVSLSVGLAMGVNVFISPAVALLIPELLYKEHSDPALGGGPFTTVIQDFISIGIYLMIAMLVLRGV